MTTEHDARVCEVCGVSERGETAHNTVLHHLHDRIEALEQRCADLERDSVSHVGRMWARAFNGVEPREP